ncbi:amidase [Algimonas ampicilliniresistens]|uniref:Amidase n=1 Tax=Algimonas ampicilliniresistens TaxID=1298735 RepID=A0ABQ5VA79_9PROT|nr:amidase [Algimonas ampicilliniresistens]GLQ24436.1 amidase [Algimonas ampicilliniresistens]
MKNLYFASAAALSLVACSPTATVDPSPQPVVQTSADYAATGLMAQSLPELAIMLDTGEATATELTQAYLDRIDAIDRNGPRLQSVLALNPDAMAQAESSDARRAAGETLGPLDGLPILLKDNIETLDPVATTAGAFALQGNITGRDSPLVAGLRAQGAVILGKTNLSQWANFRSNDSVSGWSAVGGQVRNPHMLDRSPCGSSSGSGVAMAAGLAAGAVGTETNGSIICPSNVNGIVGFKPTVGVVSQQYIVPISSTQDTAGPMTRTVRGAAMMLDAMATDGSSGYAASLDAGSLQGKRVGVLRFSQGSADIQSRFNAGLAAMEAAGAELVEIEEFEREGENYGRDSFGVLQWEFKATLDEYLADSPADIPVRSLEDVIAFNLADPREMAVFDQSIMDSSNDRSGLDDPDYLAAKANILRATGERGIDAMMAEYNVDMLVSPSGPLSSRVDPVNGDTWPSWAGAGYLAAVAGYPHVTVPMGAVHSVPLGFSIMGSAGQDKAILSYGYALEQATQARVEPTYLRDAYDVPELKAALEPGR